MRPEKSCVASVTSAEAKGRQELGYFHQSFRFAALFLVQRLASILAVEQRVKTLLHGTRQLEPCPLDPS
jgi:hypothetical protein